MIVLQYHPAFLTTVDAQGLATLAVAGTNLTTNSTFSTTAKGWTFSAAHGPRLA